MLMTLLLLLIAGKNKMAGRVQMAGLVAIVMTVSHVSAFVLPGPLLAAPLGIAPLVPLAPLALKGAVVHPSVVDQLPKQAPFGRPFQLEDAVPGATAAINSGTAAASWGGSVLGGLDGGFGTGGFMVDSGDLFFDGANMIGTGALMQMPQTLQMLPDSLDNIAVVGGGGQGFVEAAF
ncbi:hypothetical protein BaRGS_00036260 [Batillaria attramentaria]|uniref:Uncharacterized protein n=1 Tax=Batillaria attramentaria TaxID=370345 RepID=A0ABD0JC95_9CAEN